MTGRPGTHSISWDWKQGPDVDDLVAFLGRFGLHAVHVNAGTDDLIVVASTEPLTAELALHAYENNQT
jgi:hypothetical protein